MPNDSNTAVLRDRLIGSDTRIICVKRSLQETCSPLTAEVIVDDIDGFGDVRAEWLSDRAVRVVIEAGSLRRSLRRSPSTGIAIQVDDRRRNAGLGDPELQAKQVEERAKAA